VYSRLFQQIEAYEVFLKIVIVGAGVVGLHLAKTLSWQEHEIVVIDHDPQLIDHTGGSLDVMAIRGSGTSIKTLVDAGVENADLLIAVTSVDEVNIVACMLASQLGAKKRIARVRNQEYSRADVPVELANLGIDQIIHPELEAAREVEKMIRYQHVSDIVECADGQMILAGFRINDNSALVGVPFIKLIPRYLDIALRVVAISHGGKTIVPSGKDSIAIGDTIYVITHRNHLDQVFQLAGKSREISHDVMLLGGGLVGRLVAERLERDKGFNIKLIESDIEQSRIAAETLENTIVVRGSEEMDIDLMVMEGIEDMGVFAALSDDDESNIVTSLFARHLKVKRTISLISKPEYMAITRAIGLDAAVNELLLTSDAILKHLISDRVLAVSTLRGINAEIIDFMVSKHSKAAGKKLKNIKFPRGAIVGAIEQLGEVSVAEGESVVHAGDRVVVFCLPETIPNIEKLFG